MGYKSKGLTLKVENRKWFGSRRDLFTKWRNNKVRTQNRLECRLAQKGLSEE